MNRVLLLVFQDMELYQLHCSKNCVISFSLRGYKVNINTHSTKGINV